MVQAARLGFSVGITREDLVGAQCGAVIGLAPQDEEWRSGKHMAGVRAGMGASYPSRNK